MTNANLSATPPAAEAQAAIIHLNDQYIEASRTHDQRWFREHMADGAIIIFGSSRRVDKREFIALLRDEPVDYKELSVCNVTVRVFGDVAQVDADAPWKLKDGRIGVSRYIDTYCWIDSRWQVISAQITWIPAT